MRKAFFCVSLHRRAMQAWILLLVSFERGTPCRIGEFRPWLSDRSRLGRLPAGPLCALGVARVGVVGPTRESAYWRLHLFYGLIAATRRVAAQGPAAYQKRGPSDRRSVIFSPQASSSLAYARVYRMSAIASLPPFLSTRAPSRSAFARSPAPETLWMASELTTTSNEPSSKGSSRMSAP